MQTDSLAESGTMIIPPIDWNKKRPQRWMRFWTDGERLSPSSTSRHICECPWGSLISHLRVFPRNPPSPRRRGRHALPHLVTPSCSTSGVSRKLAVYIKGGHGAQRLAPVKHKVRLSWIKLSSRARCSLCQCGDFQVPHTKSYTGTSLKCGDFQIHNENKLRRMEVGERTGKRINERS